MGKYTTKHRLKIKDFFKSQGRDSFTAGQIHQALTEEGYVIGTATLYRQLASLTREGFIASLQDGAVEKYYYLGWQEDCHNHYHLKCLDCGRLFHLDCSYLQNLESHMKEDHGFIISREESTLYGRCINCSGKERK